MIIFFTRKNHQTFFTCLLLVFQSIGLLAQQKNSGSESEKAEVEKAISYTNELINETQVKKQATLSDLSVLKKKITLRNSLIGTLESEKDQLQDTIFQKLVVIDRINSELILLKAEYAKMIRSAYKNSNMHQRLLYILASDDFSQAYRRLNYYKIYARQRQEQATLIEKTNKQLVDEITALMEKMDQVEETIFAVSDEKQKLNSEKKLKNEVVENLIKKEKELASNQKKIQIQADVLKNKIEQTIQEENRNGSNDVGTTETPSPLLSEEIVLTKSFTASQGKLPWPLENGIISSEFGEHDHPDIKGIKIKNNGINIVTNPGSKARAIFDGVVTRVMKVPNFNNVVIIRHGEYLSVYSNLDQVFVSKESKIKSGQDIGTIFVAAEKQKTELHFEIWKGKNHLNPVQWISSTNK